MANILEELYNGELYPAENFTSLSDEYRQLRRKNFILHTDFIQKLQQLEPPLDEEFITIIDEQIKEIPLQFYAAFAAGFKTGAKIMVKVFDDEQ